MGNSPAPGNNTNPNESLYCQNCYKANPANSAYCASCGKPLKSVKGTTKGGGNGCMGCLTACIVCIFSLFLILVALGSCSNSESSTTNPASNTEVQTAIDAIETTLEGTFENHNVSYVDGVITVNIWQEGAASSAILAASGEEPYLELWKEFVGKMEDCSISVLEMLDSKGIYDIPVVVNVLNDTNTDLTLLSVSNGIAFLDYVAEKLPRTDDPTTTVPPPTTDNSERTYILNTSSQKFHYPSCESIDDIKESNKDTFTGTRSMVIALGYEPCGRCDP